MHSGFWVYLFKPEFHKKKVFDKSSILKYSDFYMFS